MQIHNSWNQNTSKDHILFRSINKKSITTALISLYKKEPYIHMELYYKPEKLFYRKRRIYEFIINETPIKVGTELLVWI